MKKLIFATICSALLAATTLQAAAAPRRDHKITQAPAMSEQVRDARAAIYAPTYDYSSNSRGNAGAAPAGR